MLLIYRTHVCLTYLWGPVLFSWLWHVLQDEGSKFLNQTKEIHKVKLHFKYLLTNPSSKVLVQKFKFLKVYKEFVCFPLRISSEISSKNKKKLFLWQLPAMNLLSWDGFGILGVWFGVFLISIYINWNSNMMNRGFCGFEPDFRILLAHNNRILEGSYVV